VIKKVCILDDTQCDKDYVRLLVNNKKSDFKNIRIVYNDGDACASDTNDARESYGQR